MDLTCFDYLKRIYASYVDKATEMGHAHIEMDAFFRNFAHFASKSTMSTKEIISNMASFLCDPDMTFPHHYYHIYGGQAYNPLVLGDEALKLRVIRAKNFRSYLFICDKEFIEVRFDKKTYDSYLDGKYTERGYIAESPSFKKNTIINDVIETMAVDTERNVIYLWSPPGIYEIEGEWVYYMWKKTSPIRGDNIAPSTFFDILKIST